MKLIFTFLLSVFSSISFGQYWGIAFHVGFDGNDSVYHWFLPPHADTTKWMIIDTVNYPNNKWQIGSPDKAAFQSAYSVPNAIVTDTVNPCVPNDTSVFVMKVHKDLWFGFGILSFWYQLDIDTGDIAMIEVSPDTGLNWYNVAEDTDNIFSLFPLTAFSQSTNGWDSCAIQILNMPYYTGVDSFLFRFTFITDSSTTPRDGWMLDEFTIGYYGEGINDITSGKFFKSYPNPVQSTIYIDYTLPEQHDMEIKLTNAIGQVVKESTIPNTQDGKTQIDVSDLPDGMYFCIVSSNGQQSTRKVIITHQ